MTDDFTTTDFQISKKIAHLKIQLPSPQQQELFNSILANFRGLNLIDLFLLLSKNLNTKSSEIVIERSFFVNDGFHPQANYTDLKSMFSTRHANLPINAAIVLTTNCMNSRTVDFKNTLTLLKKFNNSILTEGVEAVEALEELIEKFGFSQTVIRKLIIAFFCRKNLNYQGTDGFLALLEKGGSSNVAQEINAISSSLQPQSVPFSLIATSDEEHKIDIDQNLYSRAPMVAGVVCPLPIFEYQESAYFNSLIQAPFVDQVVGITSVLGLNGIYEFRGTSLLSKKISSEVKRHIDQFSKQSDETSILSDVLRKPVSDIDFYSISPAFLELPKVAAFRQECDYFLLPKLCKTNLKHPKRIKSIKTMSELLELPNANNQKGAMIQTSDEDAIELCREHLFELIHLLKKRQESPNEHYFSRETAKSLLLNPIPVHFFLSPDELKKMALYADLEKDYIAGMLWRFMEIIRGSNDDSDYDFLRSLEKTAFEECGSYDLLGLFLSIKNFSPEIAVKLVKVMNPKRLQKCYRGIKNYQEVNYTHRMLLEMAAEITSDLDLIEQAERIALDEALAKIRAHFDSSRIYLDEANFKVAFNSKIWPIIDSFRKQVFLIFPSDMLDELKLTDLKAFQDQAKISKLSDEFLPAIIIPQLEKTFELFCVDQYFGVDSFLGRRIRHNATHGLLLGQLDELCITLSKQYPGYELQLEATFSEWKNEFTKLVDEMADYKFRFRTADYPAGLLKLELDVETDVFKAVGDDIFTKVLFLSPQEEVVSSFISGCWRLLELQLKSVRTHLRQDFTRVSLDLIDEVFKDSPRPVLQLAQDLKVAVMERIERLSSWFSPFNPTDISVSVSDLAKLIWNEQDAEIKRKELLISGNSQMKTVIGTSSKTLFDCLHVALTNASKYCNGDKEVELNFKSNADKPEELSITISSSLSSNDDDLIDSNEKYGHIKDAITAGNPKKEVLVAQGYSGIPKLCYLLFRANRLDTLHASWDVERDKLFLEFSIPTEVS